MLFVCTARESGLSPSCVVCGLGCLPPFLFVLLVLSRFVTKSMARRILGGWSVCTLMWFHVLSVVAARSTNVRDPNWGTLGAFLGPLVDSV